MSLSADSSENQKLLPIFLIGRLVKRFGERRACARQLPLLHGGAKLVAAKRGAALALMDAGGIAMSNQNINAQNRTGDKAGKENKTNTPPAESRKDGTHNRDRKNHARGQKTK
jgi:hypothetical protein